MPALVLADGWTIGQWTSDDALRAFGIERDLAMTMHLCLAGMLGINRRRAQALRFLTRWEELGNAGCFRGPWTNESGQASSDRRCRGHRHDQSAASWLCYELGIPMADLKSFVRYEDQEAPDAMIRMTGI